MCFLSLITGAMGSELGLKIKQKLNPAVHTDYCRTLLSVLAETGVQVRVSRKEDSIEVNAEAVFTTSEEMKDFLKKLSKKNSSDRQSLDRNTVLRLLSLVNGNAQKKDYVSDAIEEFAPLVSDYDHELRPDTQIMRNVSERIVLTRQEVNRLVKRIDSDTGVESKQNCGLMPIGACVKIEGVLRAAMIESQVPSKEKITVDSFVSFWRSNANPEGVDNIEMRVGVKIHARAPKIRFIETH